MSYVEVSDAAIAKVRVEEEFGEMIAWVPDSVIKVEKVWDLNEAYKWDEPPM